MTKKTEEDMTLDVFNLDSPVEIPVAKVEIPEVPSEGKLNKIYNNFKEQLADEEHVDILIPPTQLYPEGSNMPVCLNGVVYNIPVGIEFPKGVPKSIHAVWKQSYDMDREARMKMKKALTGVISVG